MASKPTKRVFRTRKFNPRVLFITAPMKLYVHRERLHINWGYEPDRQELSYGITDPKPEQIILYGDEGDISLAVLTWCKNVKVRSRNKSINGITITHCLPANRSRIMPEFTTLTAPTPTKECPDPRTMQVRAGYDLRDTLGMEIHAYAITEKIRGQAGVLHDYFSGRGVQELSDLADAVSEAETHERIRQIESEAAGIYFGVWSDCGRMLWCPTDPKEFPKEWMTYSGRESSLVTGNSRATHPVNAVLNFAYSILKQETAIAMVGQFLDPSMGIDHVICHDDDRMVMERQHKSGYGGALDYCEIGRPDVDRMVLDLLAGMELGPDDAILHRNHSKAVGKQRGIPGQCSLGIDLKEAVGDLAPLMYDGIASHVEHIAQTLQAAAGAPDSLPSKLSKSKHKQENRKRKTRGVAA